MSTPDLNSKGPRVGLIVLGASTFPHFPGAQFDNQSFARSATAFRDLLTTPGVVTSGAPALLDLFDAPEEPNGIVRRMRSFLNATPDLTDIVIYYCGHGSFLPDLHRTYILLLRSTEPEMEAGSALKLRETKLMLETQLARKRVFLVLDCCFAAQALSEWQSGPLSPVIESNVYDAFPKRGTALLAASARGEPAIAPEGQPLTMFTGALVQAIGDGVSSDEPTLSFRDVFNAANESIRASYGGRAAIPEIHAPQQRDGDISSNPFFVNRGYRAPPPDTPSDSEQEYFDIATAELRSLLPRTRVAALETLADMHASATTPAFRELIMERVLAARDTDDSYAVRTTAIAILDRLAPDAPTQTSTIPVRAAGLAAAIAGAPEAAQLVHAALATKMADASSPTDTPIADAPADAVRVDYELPAAERDRDDLVGKATSAREPDDTWRQTRRLAVVAAILIVVAAGAAWWLFGAGLWEMVALPSQPTAATKDDKAVAAPKETGTLVVAVADSAQTVPVPKSDERRTEDPLSSKETAAVTNPAAVAGAQSLLLEASDSGTTGAVPFTGSAEWSSSTDEMGLPTLIAKAFIPARNLEVELLIRKNSDPSLPASHLMEINFHVTDSFVGGSIAGLPGVLLKNDELVPGTALVGASARVVGNSFLFALSESSADTANNVGLLGSRKYVDLALIYATGRRAIITLEKDEAAIALFTDVIDAWGR